MPDKKQAKKIMRQAEANIDATAWRIFKQFEGSPEKICDYLSEKLEFNIPQDIFRKHKNTDEIIIFSDPTLLGNFIASLNIMGCDLRII